MLACQGHAVENIEDAVENIEDAVADTEVSAEVGPVQSDTVCLLCEWMLKEVRDADVLRRSVVAAEREAALAELHGEGAGG